LDRRPTCSETSATPLFGSCSRGAPSSVCYPPETLERLRRIKLERDPEGTIRSNKPVLGD